METITLTQLQNIMPSARARFSKRRDSKSRAEVFLPYLQQFMEEYGITSPISMSYFLATIAVESAELRFTEEIASGVAYEGRKDLGNKKPGDGVRYKGRGLIQLTGYNNYKEYSTAVGFDFYSTTAKAKGLAQPGNAVRSACWFWWKHDLNTIAAEDNPIRIRKIVNGGLNGYPLFIQYVDKAKSILMFK